MKPEIPHRCWIDGTDWILTDRALYDSCIDPRTASSERFLAKRDDLIMETLALEIGIPFFLEHFWKFHGRFLKSQHFASQCVN